MSAILHADTIERGLRELGVPADKARAQALREAGLSDVRTTEQLQADEAREESGVVRAADKQMRALGFVVVNYSQPRASKQTPGVQDHEYFHPARGIFLKWEAKSPTGRQSPDQVTYQEWCDACHVPYVCGTDRDLFAWLLARYPLRWDDADNLVWREQLTKFPENHEPVSGV